MRITVVCFMALCYILATARSITGVVTDEKNLPLALANVVLLKDSTYIDGVASDDSGAFRFANAPDSANQLKISMIGYEELWLPVPADGNCHRISLRPSSVMLGEVTVKGDASRTKIKGNALVTRVENSILASAGSAKDVLKRVPMLMSSEGSFSVAGRGQAVIYINGRLVRDPAELDKLSSGDIKEVEVIGTPGAQYDGSVNAVIRIITKKPVGEGVGVSSSIYGSYNKYYFASGYTTVTYRKGGLEISAMGSLANGDTPDREIFNIETYGKKSVIVDTTNLATKYAITNKSTGKIEMSYQINPYNNLGAYYQYDFNRQDYAMRMESQLSENGLLYDSSVVDAQVLWLNPRHSTNVYYSGKVGQLSIDFNSDYISSNTNQDAKNHEQSQMAANRDITLYNRNSNSLFAHKTTISYPLLMGTILIGEEYTNTRSSNDFWNIENIFNKDFYELKESNSSVFAELTQAWKQFNATAGLRYEQVNAEYYNNGQRIDEQSRRYSSFFPTAGITYSPGDFNYLLSYRYQVQRPTYRELTGNYTYVNSTLYTRGNPYLRMERQQTAMAQASWRYISLSATYTDYDDARLQVNLPYEGNDKIRVFTHINVPEYKVLNLYLSANPMFGVYQPSFWLGWRKQWFSFPYRDQAMSFNQPTFQCMLDNTFTLPRDWFVEASLYWRQRGVYYLNWINTRDLYRVDIRIYKHFLNKSLTAYLDFSDIFNSDNQYALHYSYATKMRTDVMRYNQSISINIRYKFNTSKSRYKGTGAGESEKSRL